MHSKSTGNDPKRSRGTRWAQEDPLGTTPFPQPIYTPPKTFSTGQGTAHLGVCRLGGQPTIRPSAPCTKGPHDHHSADVPFTMGPHDHHSAVRSLHQVAPWPPFSPLRPAPRRPMTTVRTPISCTKGPMITCGVGSDGQPWELGSFGVGRTIRLGEGGTAAPHSCVAAIPLPTPRLM